MVSVGVHQESKFTEVVYKFMRMSLWQRIRNQNFKLNLQFETGGMAGVFFSQEAHKIKTDPINGHHEDVVCSQISVYDSMVL